MCPSRPISSDPSGHPLVNTVEELHLLLWLRAHPTVYAGAADVAEGVGLSTEAVARCLEALARRNLLDVRLGDDIKYRYAPARPEQAAAVDALADAWRRSPAALLRGLMSRRPLREFSDAFKFRDDDDNG